MLKRFQPEEIFPTGFSEVSGWRYSMDVSSSWKIGDDGIGPPSDLAEQLTEC
jgi:hypothetical protein